MERKYYLADRLEGYSDLEKQIYKYMLEQFSLQTKDKDAGDIYHNDGNKDFVTLTDETILQEASDKFEMAVSEIDDIFLKIDYDIQAKQNNN